MRTTLDEACVSIADGDHQAPPKSADGIPFITISCLDPDGGKPDFESAARVPLEYYESLADNRRAKGGDVLLSVVGSLGIPYLVKSSDQFVFQRHIAILRPGQELLPEYLYYLLRSPESFHYIDSVAQGAAQRTLTLTQLRAMEVDIPSIDEQRRRITAIEPYDNLIENNRRQIVLLEEAAQRLYREWFVSLRFPGHEGVEIVDGMPKGWQEKKLFDIADVVMGQSPKSEYYNDQGEGLPFHQGVSSYGLRFVTDETYSTSFTRIGKAGSILFSVRAPVGRLNYTKHEIVLGRGLAAMNHRHGLQSYLYYLLKERFFKEDMIGNGSIFASISKSELLAQTFLVPTDELAAAFNAFCVPIDRQIEKCDDVIKAAQEARDRLLPKLMSGEVEV